MKFALKLTTIFYLGTAFSLQAHRDLIENMSVKNNKMDCIINSRIYDQFLTEHFFIEYGPEINLEELPYEILSMPIVLNLATVVWFSGEDYYVDSMDKNLYESLKKIKQIIQLVYQKTEWDGNIIPRKIVDLAPQFDYIHKNSTDKVLLFSGGLDSTSSFFKHKDEKLHLVTACGQPDMSLGDHNGFADMKVYINNLAQAHGHTTSFFRSNYHDIFSWKTINNMYPDITSWRCRTMEAMSWAGVIIPILIAKKCSSFYLASGGTWYYNSIDGGNPFIDSCLNFAGFTTETDQFEMTRFQKVKFVVDTVNQEHYKKPFLKVCTNYSNKCCKSCFKCLSLMGSLITLGEDIREYGFDTSDSAAISSIMGFLEGSNDYYDEWSFMELQLHARKYVEPFTARKKLLEPFLNFDMTKLNINSKLKAKVNWLDLKKLVPEVEIPRDLSEELLAWT